MERFVVMAAYVGVMILILAPPRGLRRDEPAARTWWRDVRFWACFVLLVQVGVYAWWG